MMLAIVVARTPVARTPATRTMQEAADLMIEGWRFWADFYRRDPRHSDVPDPARSALRLDHLADQLEAIMAERPLRRGKVAKLVKGRFIEVPQRVRMRLKL